MSNEKKRGRPIKNEDVSNERKEEIQMESKISIQQPYERMIKMFQTYGGVDYVSQNRFLKAMGNSFSNNPFIQNARLKRINSPINQTEKTNLDKAMKSPEENEDIFRSESQSLYFQNYVYSNFLKLNREVPQYYYYATPINVTSEDCKKKDFLKEMHFVNEVLKKFNPRLLGKNISMDVALEGKRSYVLRKSYKEDKSKVYFASLQKLPSRWVKYTHMGSNTDYVTSFDFMMFLQPGEDINNYPPFFKDIWEDLLNQGIFESNNNSLKFNPNALQHSSRIKDSFEFIDGRYMYWVELPQTEVFEFGSDNSHALQLPEYMGMFSDFRGLDDYKWLQNQLLSKSVNSVLVGTVPLIKDHNLAGGDQTAISMDSIIGFSDMFSSAVNQNIMPFFAPFSDYKLLSLPLPPEAKEINNTALKNLVNSSGMGALISTTDKPSIISVKTAQKLAEAKAEYLMLQIEECLNFIINNKFGLKYEFKVNLWGGLFSTENDVKVMKEMAIAGISSVIPRLLSSMGQTVEDSISIGNYLDSIDYYNKACKPMTVVGKEQTENNTGETPKVGRKPIGNDLENDNTEISISQGNNISELKTFSSNYCLKCGTKIDDGFMLCDECFDFENESRLNND